MNRRQKRYKEARIPAIPKSKKFINIPAENGAQKISIEIINFGARRITRTLSPKVER